ncbi:alpha/beta hydrolase, partial [Nonomuraea sp. NPDC059007]|uniref:alpha/beta hydrolase n=1 Tax=Nonomuraea sp. NPDC059007 TaxID=3346692 RepID=UPI0036CD69A9
MPTTKRAAAAAAAATAALSATLAPPAAAAHPATPLDRFHHQTITWRACATGPDDQLGQQLDAAGAQCATVQVPIDYSRPQGPALRVAISRIKATDTARRHGVLLTNPGGPGGSGLSMPLLLTKKTPEIAARYDLVGMDPRFIGRSSPIRCQWKTDTFQLSAGLDRRSFDQGARLAKRLAAGCAQGNLRALPYASTRNTARDMDVIRAALGERKLSYLGYSYGTYLGATYLQMYGQRADRVVLDSAVDPEAYGPNLLSSAAPAFDTWLRQWASWSAARHAKYKLGRTREAVLATIDAINRRSAKVGAYRVDARFVPYWLYLRSYSDSAQDYATLAEEAKALHRPSRTPPPASLLETLQGAYTGGTEKPENRAGIAVLCADRAASRNPGTYYRDIQRHRTTEPLFGPLVRNITPCAFWPTRPREQPTTIGNSAPALIVGATGDTATPYPGQRAMHRALTGSRMITLNGAYRHGVYAAEGNTCVDT